MSGVAIFIIMEYMRRKKYGLGQHWMNGRMTNIMRVLIMAFGMTGAERQAI